MGEVFLLPAQAAFVQSRATVAAFVGGYGAGKSRAGVAKAIALASLSPNLRGLYVVPTYTLAQDAAVPLWEQVLNEAGVPYDFAMARLTITLPNGAQVLFRSADKWERLVAVNAAWAVVDEAALMSKESVRAVMTRVRDPRSGLRQTAMTSTPEGFNYFHHMVVEAPAPNTEVFKARTLDNPFLSRAYVETLTAHMTPDERRQYLDGEFVALSGRVFHKFDAKNIATPTSDQLQDALGVDGAFQLWADFNVGVMAWMLVLSMPDSERFHIVMECVGHNTDTASHVVQFKQQVNQFLRETVGRHIHHWDRVHAYTDAAGRARDTSASASDVEHLQAAGFTVRTPKSNPPIRDTVNKVNHVLNSGNLMVSPLCRHVVEALNSQGRDKFGNPDKSGGHDHYTDAIRYGVNPQVRIHNHADVFRYR